MPNVLLIDDDKAMTTLLKTMLEFEDGFVVDVSYSGKDAKEYLSAQTPDIILVDFHLKDINGLELVTYVRATDAISHVPIIVVSGLDVEDEARTAGADAFIIKPFEPGDMPSIILGLID